MVRLGSRIRFLLLVGFLLIPALVWAEQAQQTSPATNPDTINEGQRTPVMSYVAARRASTPPVVDGSLDDAVWRTVTPITEFVQRNPVEGAPPTEATEVYFAYDSRFIYVAFYAHYSDAALIRANRVDRDRILQDDTMSVYLDTFHDQQSAVVFSVNGYGVQGDSMMAGAGGGGGGGNLGDASWDALFVSAGRLVDDGWIAELAIPFKSLRYPSRGENEPHRWGLQITRSIQSKDEELVWSPVSRGIPGFLTQMGLFDGMTNLSTSHNFEILPTFTALHLGTLDETGRFGGDIVPEGGINAKYGITPNLTLDVTYNPDFSQVESDRPQIEVNQRFPLFFPELRPFFLEGDDAFATRGPVNLVHTRTIVDPRYGAKLTGKAGKMVVGAMVANDEAPGKRDDPTDPGFEKNAQFFIARARWDLYSESYIGVLATDREFLDAFSRVGGVDGWFRIGQTKIFDFRYMSSSTRAEDDVRSSGVMFNTRFAHTGRNLSYSVYYDHVEPGFKTESGFVRRVDTRQTRSNVGYRWWPEGKIINWGPRVNAARTYDFDGVLQDQNLNAGVNIQFARNINLNAGVDRDLERYKEIDFRKSSISFDGNVNTSRAFSIGGAFSWGDRIRFGDDPFLGRGGEGRLSVTLRPTPRLQSDLSLNTSRLRDPGTLADVFDVKIFRTLTTYQFTGRLLVRSINEINTFTKKLGVNLLLTYRVNSGTVFYVGYDDHWERGDLIDEALYPARYTRTKRALFTKIQYLFRR